ncbi:hypothetical protein RND71_043846 [Anisodus tanguticus]|uniref:Proteasome subunit beta n=1 Tax=Anisodus tanguticus TaxID=243964 RepID=A0AAE1QPP5_9SOLA|nr:hypothetical protein RND71_043846 [Anisodus tanguticus]
MSIVNYNGGSVLAMAGKDCVGIACDKQFTIQYTTVDTNYTKIYEMGPKIFVGIPGLATDAITLSQRLKFRQNMFELRENRKMNPNILASLISNMLYEKRFGPYFVEPIIAALDKTNKPILYSYDSIGSYYQHNEFVSAGSATVQILGACESLWEPNLEPDDLFETLSQCILTGCERDAKSGHGAYVYIIEKDKVTISDLKTRMD